MLQISEKGRILPSSPIRKLTPFADAAKAKGVKVYHLNIGQPDIESPEVAMETVRRIQHRIIEYTNSAGNMSLRKKLATYYNGLGIKITYENILITTGASEAMLFAFMSTLNDGDEIIIPEPYYANYTAFATMCGVKVKPVTSTIKNNFALPSMEEFEKAIGPHTKGIVIINPNNPTGALYSKEDLHELGKIVAKHELYLYSDEVYRRYCYEGEHFSVMNIEGIEENTILFDSMSKRFSECGIRVGAIISRNKDVISTCLKIGMARLCPPSLGQIAAEASLDAGADYYKNVRDEYMRRRNFIIPAMNKIPGVICPMPQGAFYAIAKLPVDDAEKFAKWMLTDFNYNGETVMLAPAAGFYATPGMGKQEVRIAYVLKIPELEKAVKVLEEGLKEYLAKEASR